jgi:hypothetical protein
MLNNIGLPGVLLLLVFVGVPIWLISRASGKKRKEQARIADALEKIARTTEK